MKTNCLWSIFFLVMVFGCKESCPVERDCLEKTLQELKMVPYEGEDIGCNPHVALYQLDGDQYFMLGNHCADMVTYPFDCNGNKLCENRETPECVKFQESAQYVGIVGVLKH